jgi:gluconate 5-dehydrogenase
MSAGLFDLSGQVALVTGTSRGLGQYFARALAGAGADLILTSRDRATLAPFAAEIAALGRRTVSVSLDVTNQDSITQAVAEAEAAFGRIDILVNNAGMNIRKPAVDVTWENWNQILDTNLRGSFFVAQAVARGMIARGYGRIINITSISGIVGMLDHAAYVATKGGLNALTQSLAMEWGPHGITVNAIAPTVVLTAMGERVWGAPEKGAPMKAKIPIGRFGKPREVAAAVIYLASDAAGLVNGHVLVLDGGYTAA